MRRKIKIININKGSLNFLYNTVLGRCILKVLTLPVISKIVGAFMNSKLSVPMIKKFILKNNINMDEFVDVKYKSYNEFFTRKIKENKRNINKENNILIQI